MVLKFHGTYKTVPIFCQISPISETIIIFTQAGLEQICEVCGIKLRRVKSLNGLEKFKYSMQRFR